MSENLVLTEAAYYILLSVCRPCHGYGIMQQTEELSKGRIKLAPGTLYGALTNLTEKGWITLLPAEDGSRKKDYLITEKGREVLKNEITRLHELVENGERIMGESVK